LIYFKGHVIIPHKAPIMAPTIIDAITITIATPILSELDYALLNAILSAIPKQKIHSMSSNVPAAII
jgi:hypothetical protein